MARRSRTDVIVCIATVIGRYGGSAGAGEGQSTTSGSTYDRNYAGAGCGCVDDGNIARWSGARPGYANGYYDRSTSCGRIGYDTGYGGGAGALDYGLGGGG